MWSIVFVPRLNNVERPPVDIIFIFLGCSDLIFLQIPSTKPIYPQNIPDCIQATVFVPITFSGCAISI